MSLQHSSLRGGADAAKTAYDPETPPALIDFMSTGWLDRPLTVATHPQAQRLRRRREALSQRYPGSYVLVPAGRQYVRANDTFFRFRPASDFVYLMGDGEPGGLLVFEPDGEAHRTLLFARQHNRGRVEFFTDRVDGELWVGRHRGVDESQLYYGVDACRPASGMDDYLEALSRSRDRVRLLRGHNEAIDHIFEPADGDSELAAYLSEVRLIKDDYELGELKKACAISKRGFEDAIAAMATADSEREIEAAFWRRARIEGNDVGYLTIAASGEHACTLHWTRNDGAVSRNALLLLDAGVECDSLYTADITRTLPISGHFSPEQRAVYDIVLQAQKAGIAAVSPGNDFLEPNRRAMRVLAEGLIELKILRTSLDEALDPQRQYYRRYTLHNVSHMLGLDVHDCANARAQAYRYGALREGMILTVEPGLYFQPDDETVPQPLRGIGVRLEDDIAVTADGAVNLSGELPSEAADVETWIASIIAA
jgi:Xaa-Pro aminopeptidase